MARSALHLVKASDMAPDRGRPKGSSAYEQSNSNINQPFREDLNYMYTCNVIVC